MTDSEHNYEIAPLLGCLGVCLASVSSALAAGLWGGLAACGVFAISRKAADITGYKKCWTTTFPIAAVIAVSVYIALTGMFVAILISGQLRSSSYGYTLYNGSVHLAAGGVIGAASLAAAGLLRATCSDHLSEVASAGNPRLYACSVFALSGCAFILHFSGLMTSLYLYSR